MVRKTASLTAGKFIPTVITASGLKMGARRADSTFKKLIQWRAKTKSSKSPTIYHSYSPTEKNPDSGTTLSCQIQTT
jgi:hypothetical protein